MNKKLIALAVAAAIAPAAAMADSGNVTIYGEAAMAFESVDYGNDSAVAGGRHNRVSNNQSHLGFKGTEDLGNGLSAVWQFERGIVLDGAADTQRNSYVGLSSKSMGTVLMGQHDTPYKLATAKLDVFANTVADYNGIMGASNNNTNAASTADGAFDLRPANVLAYISPTVSGVHAAIAYVAADEAASLAGAQANSAWSAVGIYDNGPLFVSLAYERHELQNTANDTEKAWKLGAGYNFGATKVGFAYEKVSDDTATVAGNDDNHKAWYLSLAHQIGANTLKFAYTRAGDTANTADTGANQISVGVSHALSKRTNVHALYTKVNNDTAGLYGLASTNNTAAPAGVAPSAAGQDPSAISLGISHKF